MQEPEIISPGGRGRVGTTSWLQAYFMFLKDGQEHRTLKLMPLVLLGAVPLSIADDFLLPVLGAVDDLPTVLVAFIVLVMTYLKVRKYR